MNIISADKLREFCVEVCRRLGDEYTGPNMASTEYGVINKIRFHSRMNDYTAILTRNGVVVFDKDEKEVLHIPDMNKFHETL